MLAEASFLVLLAISGTQGQLIGCFVDGECYSSIAVGVSTEDTPHDCLDYCKGVADCLYFTHFSDTSTCIAFRDTCSLNDTVCNDCVSGDVTCEGLTCDREGQCEGQFIQAEVVSDKGECDALCQNTLDCEWWTFRSDDNICTEFRDCPEVDTSCTTCISGQAGCEGDVALCDVEGICEGSFLTLSTENSKEECVSFCQGTTDCEYWTYNSDTDTCTAFSTCTQLNNCTTCVSGERDCNSFLGTTSEASITTVSGASTTPLPIQDGSIMFVVGGEAANSDSIASVEAVDVSGNHRNCELLPAFPHEVQLASGYKTDDGHPVVCGGYSYVSGQARAYATCYEYNPSSNTWDITDSLSISKYAMAGAMLDSNTFWISGGRDLQSNYYNDIDEILVSSGSVSDSGVNLPNSLAYHCLVRIDQDRMVLIGGYSSSGSASDQGYLYDIPSNSFQLISGSMGTRRYGHACGYARSTNRVIVAGNMSPMGGSTDVLNLDTMTWSTGPSMPFAAHSMAVAYTSDSDGFFFVGGTLSNGATSQIVEYRSDSNDFVTRNEDLSTARGAAIVLTVDDSIVTCS